MVCIWNSTGDPVYLVNLISWNQPQSYDVWCIFCLYIYDDSHKCVNAL